MQPSDEVLQPNKKICIEGSVAGNDQVGGGAVHANKFVRLHFLDIDSTYKMEAPLVFIVHPDFTHQLWEDEKIFLESSIDSGVIICIACDKFLEHAVQFKGIDEGDQVKILNSLQPGLPSNTFVAPLLISDIKDSWEFFHHGTVGDKWYRSLGAMTSPPGVIVSEFRVGDEQHGVIYELRLANKTDEAACQLLLKLEKVAMWFIETADSVNFSEDDRWEILFLFQKHRRPDSDLVSYSVVGYMTLFTFRNPFQGSKLRICQALILPHHQGKGFGRIMMLQVYAIAKERNELSEVTVEDPAPGFQCLRDRVDCEWALKEVAVEKLSITAESRTLAKLLKITSSQAVFVTEAFLFESLVPRQTDLSTYKLYDRKASREGDTNVSATADVGIIESLLQDSSMREFRLTVKRRLLKENNELKLLPKVDMQRELENLFQIELKRFIAVLKVTRNVH